jgi:prophage regulatory protein
MPELIKISEVCSLAGVSRSCVYRWIQRGGFPRPVNIGVKCSRWDKADVMAWYVSKRASSGLLQDQA